MCETLTCRVVGGSDEADELAADGVIIVRRRFCAKLNCLMSDLDLIIVFMVIGRLLFIFIVLDTINCLELTYDE